MEKEGKKHLLSVLNNITQAVSYVKQPVKMFLLVGAVLEKKYKDEIITKIGPARDT